MSMIENKLQEMGLELPVAPKPVAAYIPAIQSGNMVFTSGQIPFLNGELKFKGKLGQDVTVEEGYEAAKLCALNCLSVIKAVIGDLDRIEQIVKVNGFVNSIPEFSDQPKVINGASELFSNLLGEAGKHARAAVGSINLPMNAACEVEVIVRVKE
jgi:enamine deaminase RidA (YjgF/YER057c/UK114 family)